MNSEDAGQRWGEGLRPGEQSLGPYAASGMPSRGRQWPEEECTTRSPFQRDRDRVLHSAPFRRLTYKTQVFVYHEGDHYRTRLTHSLEVAQVARTVARQLRLNEDLAEVLALAHDLGHPPFGHAGERALDQAMVRYGGFDHNVQSLRIVTKLEHKYAEFDGLNLSWETLEGLAKHNGPIDASGPLREIVRELASWRSLDPERWGSAESQVAALADDVAYLNHDIDDGLRAGLIRLEDMAEVPLVGAIVAAARGVTREEPRVVYEVTRRMITAMIGDLVAESRRRLMALAPRSPDDIRSAGQAVIAFSPAMFADLKEIRAFLFERVYRSPRVMRTMRAAEDVVSDLFGRYLRETGSMPETWQASARVEDEARRARVIADFVAGMTDRYAMAEHRRLFDVTPELR
jgi:dGTPase